MSKDARRFRVESIHDFVAGGYRDRSPRCLTVRGTPVFLLIPFEDAVADGIHEFDERNNRCRRCGKPDLVVHGTLAKDT